MSKWPLAGKPAWWQTYAVGLLVCAGLSIGCYFFGVEPAIAQRDAAAAGELELQSRRQKVSDGAASLAQVHAKLAQAQRDVQKVSLRLDSASNVNQRLARLVDLAMATGITLDQVQPEPPHDGPYCQTVPIHISGTGGYPACAVFLNRLHDQFSDTAVRSFEIVSTGGSQAKAKGTFRLELAWYATPVKK